MIRNKIISLLSVFMMTPLMYLLFFSYLSIHIKHQFFGVLSSEVISKGNVTKKWKLMYHNCLAPTGHLVQNENIFISELLSYPMAYYDRLGKQITDKIRDRICSASKDNIKDVINCPSANLDSELGITKSPYGCRIKASSDKNLSLIETKDGICGYFDRKNDNGNRDSVMDDIRCYEEIKYSDPNFYQDFFDCQVNKVITDYKTIIRDRERFRVILSAIDDYCNPAPTSNGGALYDGDKEELEYKEIEAFQNNVTDF